MEVGAAATMRLTNRNGGYVRPRRAPVVRQGRSTQTHGQGWLRTSRVSPKFVEDDEVHPGQMLGDAIMPSVAGLDLQAVGEVDHVVEAAAGTELDAASGYGYGQVSCRCRYRRAARLALLGDEAAAGHQDIDRDCALELEVFEVLGERQLDDGELVFDRAGLLLVDLGVEQVADIALGFVLTLDGGRSCLQPLLRTSGS